MWPKNSPNAAHACVKFRFNIWCHQGWVAAVFWQSDSDGFTAIMSSWWNAEWSGNCGPSLGHYSSVIRVLNTKRWLDSCASWTQLEIFFSEPEINRKCYSEAANRRTVIISNICWLCQMLYERLHVETSIRIRRRSVGTWRMEHTIYSMDSSYLVHSWKWVVLNTVNGMMSIALIVCGWRRKMPQSCYVIKVTPC